MSLGNVWRCALLACATVSILSGCNSYDSGLIGPPDTRGDNPGKDAGGATAGISGSDVDAAVRGDGGAAGVGATAGSGGSGATDMNGCHPNPNFDDQVCTLVCPEKCNGKDDDCDQMIDEGETEICALANAESVCTEAGQCVVTKCLAGFRDCDGKVMNGCEAPDDDVNNCGTCGKKCSVLNGSAECSDEACEQISCNAGWEDCDANANDCETSIATLDHCGGCKITCENVPNATPSCAKGYCGPGVCDVGFGDCNEMPGDGCEQPLNTNKNCGNCKTECEFAGAASSDCSTGVCRAGACTVPGYADCDGVAENGCESLDTPEHCGACDKTCAPSAAKHVVAASCADPVCELECEAGWGDCDGDAQTGCETQLNNNTHCGKCNKPCSFPHAVADCSTGVCELDHCDDSYNDCANGDADGCETPRDSNDHCGTCDVVCMDGKTCSGGACSAVDCSMGTHSTQDCGNPGVKCGNCDRTNDGDCETDLGKDLMNCGTCGNQCAFTNPTQANMTATLSCTAQGCKAVCKPGYGDCNGDYRDGCERQLNTVGNCDGCGVPCAIANASAKCTTWNGSHFVCEVATCNTDYADCDNNKTSCESALNTIQHCKTCATTCSLQNASEACTGGTGNWACTIAACDQTYYKNCNGTNSDGCEIDVRSSVGNCGACSNDCRTHAHVASATCASSACNYTCASGWKSCTSTPGCETDIHTLTDCGDCGVACARANGTAECSTGVCNLSGCNSGFQNCDGNAANGCEPLNTLIDCGACNTPCNLPNATSSCGTGSCVIASCNANFADCDGNAANGCERDTRAPASGGLGPCVPDTNCTKKTSGGHDYFFCTNVKSWSAARTLCQSQLSGDLVHIDDATENEFVRTNAGADVWIGATDAAVEGAWRWVDSNLQFWMGGASGAAVGGRYSKWDTSQPDDSSGAQDCAAMWKTTGTGTGPWDDDSCANTKRFVCEIAGDLCPSDPNKTNPQQCGCGNPDIDADGDGTAACAGQNDKCDGDPAKVAPGQCGCGAADTDSDGDGVANCVDPCPNDASKTAPGQCGCGITDTDSDNDGTANCNDACDYDNTRSAVPCNLPFTPTNVPTANLFNGSPDVNASCGGTITLSTDAATAVSICGVSVTPIVDTSKTPALWILAMNTFNLASGTTLRFTGARPVVLAVANDATVSGTIDVGAQGTTPGAGGNVSCAVGSGQGADGVHDGDSDDGDGGGGGGAYGAVGANGGSGNGGGGGGAAGAINGAGTLSPLRGGCRGGNSNAAGGGAGGGAVQILVGGKLTLGSTAVVAASGGGGAKGGSAEDGGAGGGSGGAVFIEANLLSVDANAWITANGGGGGGGNPTAGTNGSPGTDGLKNNTSRAPGGSGGDAGNNDSNGGNGGQGGAQAGAATAGASASDRSCTLIFICGAQGGGGGGGGGGAGRIRIHGIQAGCSVPTAKISPAATVACP